MDMSFRLRTEQLDHFIGISEDNSMKYANYFIIRFILYNLCIFQIRVWYKHRIRFSASSFVCWCLHDAIYFEESMGKWIPIIGYEYGK